jgi:predicted permease
MRWLRPLFRRSQVEHEMDTEMRFHFDRLVEDLRAKGLSPEEARRRARLEFGGIDQLKDDAREARMADRVEQVARGLRMAVRNLLRTPGFTAIAILTLALGIGVNTVMFSLFDQLLLRDLPVRDPQRLVVFHGNFVTPGMYRSTDRLVSFSWPKYLDFRDRCDVFEGVAARFVTRGSLEYNGATEGVAVELVTGNYFDVLGVKAAVGRVLSPADSNTEPGEPVVVLGYSYWQKRFGGDPSIVGRQIRVNGLPMNVVGVSAGGFHSIDRGNEEDIRVPITRKTLFTPAWPGLGPRNWAWLNIVARIKPAMSRGRAEGGANIFYRQVMQDEAKALSASYPRRKEFLADHLDLRPAAAGMMDQTDDQRAFFTELMVIAGVVLLIACVNLAGLLMARTTARQRELAIRLALGAGRMGLVRQLLTENLLLAIAGGAAGVLIATLLVEPASRFVIPPEAGTLIDTQMDVGILLFAFAASVATAIAFALAPALQMRRSTLASVLRNESGASSNRAQVRLRKVMVTAQLAFCVWLMIAAGLFARTLSQLRNADLGFRREHLITFQLDPMISGYKPADALATHRRVMTALAALPGVTSVANSDYGVLTGGINVMSLRIEGYRPPPPDTGSQVQELVVSPDYFRTLGMQFIAGRDFTPADVQQEVHTVIVNEAFARKYFAGQNPVGRRIGYMQAPQPNIEVVGVVRDQRYYGPTVDIKPFFYIPAEQNGRLSFYARVSQAPEAMIATIGRAVAREAPGVPLDRLRSMEAVFDASIGSSSRIAALAGFFGLLATALAAIGLYGVMAFNVTRRTREIGIRMAVGAARGNVLWLVIREVAIVIAGGLLVGLPTGLALARLVRAQLYGVSPLDATSAVAASVVVAAIALIAGFLPARRATRIDPVRALRWD